MWPWDQGVWQGEEQGKDYLAFFYIMIHNNKYIFCPHPPNTELLKPLEFLKWGVYKEVFCYDNKVAIGSYLRMGAGYPWSQPCAYLSG